MQTITKKRSSIFLFAAALAAAITGAALASSSSTRTAAQSPTPEAAEPVAYGSCPGQLVRCNGGCYPIYQCEFPQ
jgi:hypothetical protein